MKRNSLMGLIVLLICLGFAAEISAQTPEKSGNANVAAGMQNLSLAQAREVAFERNWDLLAAKSGIDSATAQLIVTREFPNPTVSLSTFKIGTHESATVLGNGVWERSYDTIATRQPVVGDRRQTA